MRQLTKREADAQYSASAGTKASPYVPFVAALIAEPDEEHSVVDMLEALPEHLRRLYEHPHQLWKSEPDQEEIRRKYAGRFRTILGSHDEWVRYLHRPVCRRLWRLARADEARATLSVAAVLKKDGTKLRKILQSVPFNEMIVSPDVLTGGSVDYGLQGAVSISQASSPSRRVFNRTLDLSNAFTYVATPLSWAPYMAGPSERTSCRLGGGAVRAP